MSAYQMYEFDGVALPLYNPEQDHGAGAVDSTLLASAGGTFDVWAGLQRAPRVSKHVVAGIYAADADRLLLVDHAGNYLIDHGGRRILAATAQQHLRGQVDAVRAKLGRSGQLWRRRWDNTSVRQWKQARLLSIADKSDTQHRTVAAKLDLTFESAMAYWRDAAADTASATLATNGAVGLLLSSDGNATIEDSTLSVTASGTIRSLAFVVADLGIDLRWAGSLAAGQTLRLNCGDQTVSVGSAAAYAGFTLGPGHTARGWLPLPPGLWTMLVTSGGPGTVTASHYDQWV